MRAENASVYVVRSYLLEVFILGCTNRTLKAGKPLSLIPDGLTSRLPAPTQEPQPANLGCLVSSESISMTLAFEQMPSVQFFNQ